MRGNPAGGNWHGNPSTDHSGDLFYIGVSQLTPAADVATSIVATPSPVVAGQPLSFAVTYTNAGPGSALDYTQTLKLTPGLGAGNVTFSNLPSGVTATYSNTTGLVTFSGTPTTLFSGSNQNLTVNIGTVPTGLASITATTTVGTSSSQGADTGANSATSTVTVAPIADLLTTISGPTSATQGNQVTLDITTTNNSTLTALNVVQTVQLPSNLTNVFVSNNGTYVASSGLVTFPTLASLSGGQTVGNYISFTAPGAGFAPSATVTPNTVATGDSNPANNTAYLNGAASATSILINAVPTGAPVANLYTTITPSALTVSPGTDVTFTVLTANAGPAAAYNVVETVQLLPGLTALKINGAGSTGSGATGSNELLFANGNTYNTVTGLVTFSSISSLAIAGSANNTLTFAAPANVGGQLLATAAVSSTSATSGQVTTDPVPADNVASTKVTILPTADLVASITGPSSISAGQLLTYTATFTNNGPATVASPIATVQLPVGLTDVETLGLGTYNATTGVVTFPSLSTSTGVARSYSISFTPATTGTYTASATYTSNITDSAPANNTASVATSATANADLSVILSGPATVPVNGAVTYVAETTNNGPSSSGAFTTTIQLPANLATAPVLSANGTYTASSGLVTFTNSSLVSGATITNYATYINTAAANTAVSSTATVINSINDLNTTNNSSSTASTNAVASNANGINMSTTVTPTSTTVAAGASITLTVVFDNNASSNAVSGVSEVLYLTPGTVVTSTGFTYNQTTGVLIFNNNASLAKNGTGATDTYTVVVTAPTTGALTAVSTISGPYAESVVSNNVSSATFTVSTTPATGYDEATVITGPASALPGAAVMYIVQSINNGATNSGSVVQSVSFPAGTVITNNGGGAVSTVGNTTTITFPAFTNQAPGAGGEVFNTFTVTMPASGSLAVTASVTAAGETASATGNNTSSTTTAQANAAPVAASIVNALKSPEGNTAGQLLISELTAVDANGGTIASFQLTSIPDAATQGVLYYNNGGTYTAITNATQSLTTDQAKTLRFDPVPTFVGNVSFTYTATDNQASVSLPALYTIQVGQDTNSKYTVIVKGGATPYQNGDAVATVFDVNGGKYTSAGAVNPGPDGNGVDTAFLPSTGPASNPTNALPAGIAFDGATGQFTVADRTLLRFATYNMRITTTDVFGGINTQDIALNIGVFPLPVELTAFTAAVKNQDAQLAWRTASEKNNDHFDVERSLNGTDFAKIGQVKGQGTSSAATDYTLTDAGIGAKATGVVYYRLRQVDADGTENFSPVRSVTFTKALAPAISLFPNPATAAGTKLDLTALPAGEYQVSVLDATGRTVLSATLNAGLAHALDLRTVASGSYTLLVRGQNGGQVVSLTKRLIKE